jgi:hypothetical protein
MSLRGVLADFGVADIFQLIAQQRKTGVLSIESDDRELEVGFQDGQVVRARPSESRPDTALASYLLRAGGLSETDLAEARRLQEETLEQLPAILVSQGFVNKNDVEQIAQLLTNETIFELFLWDEGSFAFRPGALQVQPGDMLVGAEMVLLDALRMRDEWALIENGLPDLAVILAQTVGVEDFREKSAALETATGMRGEDLDRIFTRCDGRLTARRVIDLSRLGTFEGARGLLAMLNENMLQVSREAQKPPRSRRAVAPAATWTRGVWILLAAGLMAAALFVVPAPASRSHPLPRAGLFQARSAVELERVRIALEAHRWRMGNYPESLEVLRQGRDDFLAALPLDRYSYARGEGGYTLHER